MPTTDALATPQASDASKLPVVAAPMSASAEDEAPEATFAPDTDDRWAHMPCTD